MRPDSRRMQEEFANLASIDSLSFSERRMADALKLLLQERGFEVIEDDAGSHYGADTGNVYGILQGSGEGEPVLFCSHMDTVAPGLGKKPVFHANGKITSDGTTVLGADDVSGIVEILEGIRMVKESGHPHRTIEVLFPIAEEVFDKGTEVFDFKRIQAKEAYVLDLSGEIGSAAIQAPTLISFSITIKGKASHAGFAPEEGVNAILTAANAIARIKQGKLDGETTLNIGTIEGGIASNIVSETCVCTGESRSFCHEKALDAVAEVENIFKEEAEKLGATVEVKKRIEITAYETDEMSAAVVHFKEVCKKLDLKGELVRTFGGSDNNNFAKHGIEGIVLSCGMYNAHSVEEYTTVQDLENGARLIAELIMK